MYKFFLQKNWWLPDSSSSELPSLEEIPSKTKGLPKTIEAAQEK